MAAGARQGRCLGHAAEAPGVAGAGDGEDHGRIHAAGEIGADFDIGDADADRQGDTLLDLVIPARLGLAYSFAEPRDRLHFDFELVYDAELIYAFSPDGVSQDENSDLGQKVVDFGGFDVFHGPSGRLRLTW